MRIGAFSKHNNVSIETIRYYMELSLIVPIKKGGQYEFNTLCQRDFDRIIVFKNMGFTLNEIKRIFHFSALSRMHDNEERVYFKTFFENNLEKITKEIERLKLAEELIHKTLSDLDMSDKAIKSIIGIPLRILHLLACPSCNGDLMLKQGQVQDNKIIDGVLACSCGETYEIVNGILCVDASHMDLHYDLGKNIRVEYYDSTSPEYIEKIFEASRWMESVIDLNLPQEGIIFLEPGIGTGYALSQCMNTIPKNSVYFGVDHNLNRLENTRDYLQMSEMSFDLVLIGSDFMRIPLKDKVVDVVMDMSGSSNRAFDSSEFLMNDIDRFLKPRVEYYGMHIISDSFKPETLPLDQQELFCIENIRKHIESLAISILYEFETGKVFDGGPHEDFMEMVNGTWTYCCYGKRGE